MTVLFVWREEMVSSGLDVSLAVEGLDIKEGGCDAWFKYEAGEALSMTSIRSTVYVGLKCEGGNDVSIYGAWLKCEAG